MTQQLPIPQPQRIVLPPYRQRARRPRSVRAREWIHRNLFPSTAGTALTIVSVTFIAALTAGIVWFVFFDANWRVITDNRWLLFAGSFPHGQEWRLWAAMGFVFALIGLSYGMWSSLGRKDHLFIVLTGIAVVLFMGHGGAAFWSSLWFLLSIALLFLGYVIARTIGHDRARQRSLLTRVILLRFAFDDAFSLRGGFDKTVPIQARARAVRVALFPTRTGANRIVGGLLILALPLVLVILMAGGGASTRELDGFVLNLILAPVGIVGGLVIAIPLAIGRASKLHAIKWTCTAYIEIVRGAPLLGWLFVALFILDDIIGGDLIIRTMVVLAVFTAAYMAEYIRGALQTLPHGQYEAAQAVGLSRGQSLRLIIMPQALRISIPPIVGQAIAIWKDTTLVTVILPLRELKGNADSAIAQSEFIPDRIEAYIFVAVAFWIVAFIMSRISQRMERAQGIGER